VTAVAVVAEPILLTAIIKIVDFPGFERFSRI